MTGTMTGAFTIPENHPSLPGHFPGRPIVPGVVLLDEVTALVLAANPGQRLASFPAIRFARPVRPGDHVEVAYTDNRFTCNVQAETVAQGSLLLIEDA